MKKGDLVKAWDGSYALELKYGELVAVLGNDLEKVDCWEVLAVDCKLPADNSPCYTIPKVNDTIMYSSIGDRIVFTQEELLTLHHHRCPCCGSRRTL